MGPFLIILILLGAIWVLLVVPARRRRTAHAAMQDSVEVGDEIITAGGLHGTVTEIEDDRARVEIAPSVIVTLDRRAIAAVATEIEVEVDPEAEPKTDSGTPDEPR